MLNLGSHYYNESMVLALNKDEGVKLWRDSAGTHNNDQACLNMACHYGRVLKDMNRSLYYSEKAAILGSVEARFFFGEASYNSNKAHEGVSDFEISAKQGQKESMTMLWKAYEDGNVAKDKLAQIIRVHRNAIKSSSSEARTRGELMYEKARFAKALLGDLTPYMAVNW